jgi:threonine dehydratase
MNECSLRLPAFSDIEQATARLEGHAIVTPLLPVPGLDSRGGRVFVKAENLQVTGAFKFRGAYNRLAQLSPGERSRGVVAWSSGNHAQGIAAAGALLGVPTTVVMPADAPAIKIGNARRLGADIVFYDRRRDDREAIGQRLAGERGATLVPSYDDPDVIAGQGTVGTEMVVQARAAGVAFDAILVPAGGGGLAAGCALAFEEVSARTQVFCAEPAGFDDLARSLASGKVERAVAGATTVCDALMAPCPGELTFPINRRLLAGGFAVTDAMVFEAVRYAWRELKLVVEPAGAVGLAALLHGLFAHTGKTVGVVLSGGNVDAAAFREILSG